MGNFLEGILLFFEVNVLIIFFVFWEFLGMFLMLLEGIDKLFEILILLGVFIMVFMFLVGVLIFLFCFLLGM